MEWTPWRSAIRAPGEVHATFDDQAVVVWQAHARDVGAYALEHGHFGGAPWRPERPTRLRLGFLPLMARCGWGTAEGREVVLAVSLAREVFDGWVHQAVLAEYRPEVYAQRRSWQLATRYAQVLARWEDEGDPTGATAAGRCLSVRLRHGAVRTFARDALLGIEDCTERVRAARAAGLGPDTLVPRCAPYPLTDADRERLGAVEVSA